MERVTREELLATIREDRARFDRVVAEVPGDLMTKPILPGGWSVKDVLAHVAWGDREGIGVMRARRLVGSDLWNVSEDERNEAVVRESRSREIDEVLADYRGSFEEYTQAIEALSDDDLNEPDSIQGLAERIPGWRPWRLLYDPDHYEDHRRTIAALQKGSEPEE